MRRDRNASPCLSQRGGSEHSFFARLDKVSTGTDFTDESRSNSGVADPDFNLFDKHIGQFAAGQFFDDLWIIEFAIPTAAHQDVESCSFRKSDQSLRVPSNFIQRDIANRLAATTEKLLHFVSDQIFIIDHIFVVGIMPHGIKDQMFVSLGDSHLIRRHRAQYGNDFTRVHVG